MGELRGTHVPVLLERCLELLAPALGRPAADGPRVCVDATLGMGGHAGAILAAHPDVVLVGLDRDTEALSDAGQRLARYDWRVHLAHAVYDELPEVLDRLGYERVDGVLFDLGVSSLQLDAPDRGFAYARDAPLDMWMDQTTGITAEEVVNSYEPPALVRVLRLYGEEKFASRIVDAIVRERQRSRITTSARLADLVRDAIPAAARRTGGNPSKRTFQALRIEVNSELSTLERALPAALDRLAIGGRIVVMSYQSLEDRITKRAMQERARSTAPVDLPVEPPGSGPTLRLLTRGAEKASAQEVAANPRAASVRLRAAERVDPDAPARERKRRGVKALHQPAARTAGRSTTDGDHHRPDGTELAPETAAGSDPGKQGEGI